MSGENSNKRTKYTEYFQRDDIKYQMFLAQVDTISDSMSLNDCGESDKTIERHMFIPPSSTKDMNYIQFAGRTRMLKSLVVLSEYVIPGRK